MLYCNRGLLKLRYSLVGRAARAFLPMFKQRQQSFIIVPAFCVGTMEKKPRRPCHLQPVKITG